MVKPNLRGKKRSVSAKDRLGRPAALCPPYKKKQGDLLNLMAGSPRRARLQQGWLLVINSLFYECAFAKTAPELARLRDIHLPPPVGWWPLAVGWYALGSLLLLILAITLYYGIRCYQNGHFKRQALQLLNNYQQQYQVKGNSQFSAACVSELLKRVALVYFPRKDVASLQGQSWLQFLNMTAKGLDFKQVQHELLEIPYQPATDNDLSLLFALSQQWIKQRRGKCLN